MKTTEQKATMLRSIKDLIGYPMEATDGEIGKCHDFLFDEERWTVRYLVADTRKWLPGREVLISPYQFGKPEVGPGKKRLQIKLTKDRIKDAPPLDSDAPVSRLYELEMARFYQYQPYWVGEGLWGGGYLPSSLRDIPASPEEWERHGAELKRIEQHRLRSCSEIIGYGLHAQDGEIGKIEDFVVETGSWTIRWLVADVGSWMAGRKVIISPDWIADMDCQGKKVAVSLVRGRIKSAPQYHDKAPINRDYEGRLYDFYGRPTYW